MRRTRGLSARLIAAIGVLVALYLAVFATLLVALHDLGDTDRDARRAAQVAIAATDSRVALAQRTATRLDGHGRSLAQAASDADLPAVALLARDVRAHAAALASARAPEGGSPSANELDRRLARLAEQQRAVRATQRDRGRMLTELAWITGTTGIVATLLCALGFLAYLRRALLAPLRGVVGAAQALAAGDLRARVGEHGGSGEVVELARTFDQMADSLEESRTALERQNRELAQQRAELIEAVRSAREGASIVRAVLDTTPDAIALLDGDGAVVVDNPPMRAVRAAFAAHAPTHDAHALVPAGSQDGEDAERRDEVALPGTRRTFARFAAPVHDGRGRPIGRLLVLREVTGEREAERAKQDFFALVSHELRTPLTAILGYVELVLSDDIPASPQEHAHHLEAIERNARRLVRLVGDLLFAAQVEGAPLLLEPGVVDLERLVREAVELASPRAEEFSIALELRLAPVAPCVGDRDRLAQVVDNLISNALKFTPAGGRVVVDLAPEGGGHAQIAVTDTGVGIPQEDLPRLFDRFYRARNATDAAIPGLGLGLMIVRAIVEAHGGTVSVDSACGRGTTFAVLLPLRAADRDAGAAQTGPPGAPAGRDAGRSASGGR
jgi:signal transduction histidine kinase/HAMP domain-containing protein